MEGYVISGLGALLSRSFGGFRTSPNTNKNIPAAFIFASGDQLWVQYTDGGIESIYNRYLNYYIQQQIHHAESVSNIIESLKYHQSRYVRVKEHYKLEFFDDLVAINRCEALDEQKYECIVFVPDSDGNMGHYYASEKKHGGM